MYEFQSMSRSVGNTSNVTSLQGGSAGQVAYQSAPSTTAFAGPGTLGQVLTSNGASAPTFQTASPGAVSPTYMIFSSGSGTYTPTAGVSYIIVEAVGGGGGGGRAASSTVGWGGNGGGYLKVKFAVGTYSYSVGAAGTGSSTNGVSGSNGGNTTFSTLVAPYGDGGNYDASGTNAGPLAPTTTGAVTVIAALPGGIGYGGGSSVGNLNSGGSSFFAPRTPMCVATFGSFKNATGYGGGGGGTAGGITAGNGSAGRIIVTEYY